MGLGLEALQPIASCFRAGVGSSLLCISKDSGRQKHITLQWKRLCKSLDETWQSSEPCWHQLKKHWCTVVKSCHLTCASRRDIPLSRSFTGALHVFWCEQWDAFVLCVAAVLHCWISFAPLHCQSDFLLFCASELSQLWACRRSCSAGRRSCCMSQSDLQVAKKPSSSTLYRLCYWNRCSRPAEGTRALRMLSYILGGLYNIFVCFCVGAWKSTWCT